MATSIVNLNQTYGTIASPLQKPAAPTRPPSKLPNHLDITKHIQDVNGITNMHIHSIGHNNDGIEFVGSKDHMHSTQWPITEDMAKIISDNNNLNRKYQPLVIPYSAACYICNENKNKTAKKIAIGVLITILCLIIIITIIILVNKNNNHITNKKNDQENRRGDRENRRDDREEQRGDREEQRGDREENREESRKNNKKKKQKNKFEL